MNKLAFLLLLLPIIFSCSQTPKPVYENEAFTVYPDKVTEGEFTAEAVSDTEIISDYQSPSTKFQHIGFDFKFALNAKDNELDYGVNHRVEFSNADSMLLPQIVFGRQAEVSAEAPFNRDFNKPVSVTFQLDLSAVLEDFRSRGYFETVHNKRIEADDFQGVWIAGSVEPLTWDFNTLYERRHLKMQDADGDGMYTLTLDFVPARFLEVNREHWTLHEDISNFPQLHSDFPLIDALYNLSLEEMQQNMAGDGTFNTGAKWSGVWTRDISYSIVLGIGLLHPEASKNSLLRKVKRGRIIQDTGTGGSWPVSSDRMVWAHAAWEIYLVTGEIDWLQQAFTIIQNSLSDDDKTLWSPETGLIYGESSFLDWREQSYPRWMEPKDIFMSQCLGTNAAYYRTLRIAAQMAEELGADNSKYAGQAEALKGAVNDYLWMEDKSCYGQFLYGKNYFSLSPRAEILGEAFSVLYGIADQQRAARVVQNTPLLRYGAACLYPQIPDVPPYHNNGVWPFVQAFWTMAAAQTGNEPAVAHSLGTMYRHAAMFLTNKENLVAQTGDYSETQINSDRQLWSVAGQLGNIYKVLFGIKPESDKLRFAPFVPKTMAGQYELNNFTYRNAKLRLILKGYGNGVASFVLDGKESGQDFIPSDIEGEHTLEITLNGSFSAEGKINLADNKFSLPTPVLRREGDEIVWQAVDGAEQYAVYKNGKRQGMQCQTSFTIENAEALTELQVAAIAEDGFESFLSEAIEILPANTKFIEVRGKSGEPFKELTSEKNTSIELPFTLEKAGTYFIDAVYANGSGPINTENKCAIRSLLIDVDYQGVLVMPQRGTGMWNLWGKSNRIRVDLPVGQHILHIAYLPHNVNMNVEVNKALLSCLRIIPAAD